MAIFHTVEGYLITYVTQENTKVDGWRLGYTVAWSEDDIVKSIVEKLPKDAKDVRIRSIGKERIIK